MNCLPPPDLRGAPVYVTAFVNTGISKNKLLKSAYEVMSDESLHWLESVSDGEAYLSA
jgi:hypothetical protein